MTREDAINLLGWLKSKTNRDDDLEAIDMAIEALSAEADCSTCKHKDKDWGSEECDSCCGNNNHYASAEAVQGWIPCSERLPSAEDCPMDCMVTRRSKYVGNYTDMAVAEADGTWTHEDWKAITIKGEATCISTMDADIIAWMPLPEPYKGGEDE